MYSGVTSQQLKKEKGKSFKLQNVRKEIITPILHKYYQ